MGISLAKITVKGRVQGVWFRAFTREKARALKISGWVKNQRDGTVYAEATGDRPDLDQLIQYLYQGPESSHVEDIEVVWGTTDQRYSGFEVRY